MSSTYTNRIGLEKPGVGDRGWNVPLTDNFDALDAVPAIGDFGVDVTEVPSTTLRVSIGSGTWQDAAGVARAYAGVGTQAVVANSTNYIYLDATGTLVVNQSGFPASGMRLPLATATTDGAKVTAIVDKRVAYYALGAAMPDVAMFRIGIGSPLTVATDVADTWGIASQAGTFRKVWVVTKTAIAGSNLILDIMRSTNNGSSWTSLWATNPSNRPTIAVGSRVGSVSAFDTTTYNAGDLFRPDVIQAGTSTTNVLIRVS